MESQLGAMPTESTVLFYFRHYVAFALRPPGQARNLHADQDLPGDDGDPDKVSVKHAPEKNSVANFLIHQKPRAIRGLRNEFTTTEPRMRYDSTRFERLQLLQVDLSIFTPPNTRKVGLGNADNRL
jgi:hypothetical protein